MNEHIAVLLRVMRVNKSKYIIAWGVSATWGGTERKREPCYMLIIEVKIAVKLS